MSSAFLRIASSLRIRRPGVLPGRRDPHAGPAGRAIHLQHDGEIRRGKLTEKGPPCQRSPRCEDNKSQAPAQST